MLVEILQSDPEINVLGVANDGKQAVQQAHTLKPDVITMDIRMPIMDGFEATRRIMQECPTRIIVVSAGVDSPDLKISFNAIKAGALDVIEKPVGIGANFDAIRERLITQVKLMSEVKVVRQRKQSPDGSSSGGMQAVSGLPSAARTSSFSAAVSSGLRPATQTDARNLPPVAGTSGYMRAVSPAILAIGSSTGGPAALNVVLKNLPATLPVPVVIVQHIAPGFTKGLVEWLQGESALPLKIGKQDERIYPGEVYFAPDDQHMILQRRGILGLTQTPKVSFVRPSATVLFDTVAKHYSNQAVGVVLTGMGDDGAVGLKSIRDAGGYTLAQDQATCIVYGMPKAAVELGAVNYSLPLKDIPVRLSSVCRAPA